MGSHGRETVFLWYRANINKTESFNHYYEK